MVSFRTGPPKTHLPIQFSRFHVAEAVRFRAGQQQDVSLFERKHTNDPDTPSPPPAVPPSAAPTKAEPSTRSDGRTRKETAQLVHLLG